MSSEYTQNTYTRLINQIRKGLIIPLDLPEAEQQPNHYGFLRHSEAVSQYIDAHDYSPNTKKAMYIAMVSTIKKTQCLLDDPAMTEALASYRAKMDELNTNIKGDAEKQELTETEREKYLEWPLVLEALEKIRLAVNDIWSFQEYLICALYCLMPPVRLDYARMRVMYMPGQPFLPTTYNWLILVDKDEAYFIFNEYKTAKKYGRIVKRIPQDLLKIIYEYIDVSGLYTGDLGEFLYDIDGKPMSEWYLGQLIIRVFKRYTGKSIGVNILRHSYISHERRGELSLIAQQELASSMAHSTAVSQIYRRI